MRGFGKGLKRTLTMDDSPMYKRTLMQDGPFADRIPVDANGNDMSLDYENIGDG